MYETNTALVAVGRPNYERTLDLTADGQTNWLLLAGPGAHSFMCVAENTSGATGTFYSEGQTIISDGVFGPTVVLGTWTDITNLPQLGTVVGNWQVRLRWVRTAGTARLSVVR